MPPTGAQKQQGVLSSQAEMRVFICTSEWRSVQTHVETHVNAGWKQSLHFRFCHVGSVAVARRQRLCASSPHIARGLTSALDAHPIQDEIPSKHEHRNDTFAA